MRLNIDYAGACATKGCFVVGPPPGLADERTSKRDVTIEVAYASYKTFSPRWEPWADWVNLPRLTDDS